MRKVIAWLPMMFCYYAGELGFQVCDNWPGDWSDGDRWYDCIPNAAYRLYQRGMCLSCDLNDWAGFKLWHDNASPS